MVQSQTENKSKMDKIKDTDKGDHANKETAFVGLEINVKPFRKWMKEHYSRQSKNVGVVNAHYILTVVDQIFIFSFLHSLSDSFKKNKMGMYDVTLENMKAHIKITPYLNNTFGLYVDKYDENMDYQKQLCIDKKSLSEYINKYVFNDNFRMNMSKDSMNFLIYLVVQANVMLSNSALVMTEFAKKSRVNGDSLISSIKIHFSGKLYEDIMKKVDSVNTLLKNKEKQDSDKGKDDEGEGDDDVKTKKVKEDESDNNSEESESEQEQEEEQEEDSESEEEETKPLKKQPVKKQPSKVVNK
jgi:hypothetical protein